MAQTPKSLLPNDEVDALRQELSTLIIDLRLYAHHLRSLNAYMKLDPDVVADQIEEIING
jgi:hypothetical protein